MSVTDVNELIATATAFVVAATALVAVLVKMWHELSAHGERINELSALVDKHDQQINGKNLS